AAARQVDGEDHLDAAAGEYAGVGRESPAPFAPYVCRRRADQVGTVAPPGSAGAKRRQRPGDRNPPPLTRLGVAEPYHELGDLRGEGGEQGEFDEGQRQHFGG